MDEDVASTPVTLTIDARRLARLVLSVCLAAELLFVVLDYHVNYAEWTEIGAMRRMFNITREDGLASWFGITQTLLTALTLAVIYRAVKNRPGARWKATGWLVLTGFFLYMAVDDGAQIHERVGTTFEEMRENAGASVDAFPSYTWQLLFLPVFGALGLFMLGFLWRELRVRSARVLVLLAIACQVVAVGIDFQEGLAPDHRLNMYTTLAARYDLEEWTEAQFGETPYDTLTHFSQSIEETLEMAVISIFWFLFLRHLSVVAGDLRVQFLGGSGRQKAP